MHCFLVLAYDFKSTSLPTILLSLHTYICLPTGLLLFRASDLPIGGCPDTAGCGGGGGSDITGTGTQIKCCG